MNVYDFDKTVFDGDSEDYFFAWIYRDGKLPWNHFVYIVSEWLCAHKIISKTLARTMMYRVLKKFDDIDGLLEAYWDEHEKYMLPWYAEVQREDDVIATGTPRFLMEPMMRRLHIKYLVATEMDKHTGAIDGLFLGADLKVPAFYRLFPDGKIDRFYSDTWSDHFLADIAKEAYVLHDGYQISEWNSYFDQHPEKKVIPYRYS